MAWREKHTVGAIRYATLGGSDFDPHPAFGTVFLTAALAFGAAWITVSRGQNLRV